MEQEENMKDLVGQSEKVCQKQNDLNYLKKGLDNVIKLVVQGVDNSNSTNQVSLVIRVGK